MRTWGLTRLIEPYRIANASDGVMHIADTGHAVTALCGRTVTEISERRGLPVSGFCGRCLRVYRRVRDQVAT